MPNETGHPTRPKIFRSCRSKALLARWAFGIPAFPHAAFNVASLFRPRENHFTAWPTALYGVVLFMAAVAYYLLTRALLAVHGAGGNAKLAAAVGRDVKGKLSVVAYALAIGLAFVMPALSLVLYAVVAAVWLIPDRRIEQVIES